MLRADTKYGILEPVDHLETDGRGRLISCIPCGGFTLTTALGNFIPQYRTDQARRPKVEPLVFHENGNLRTLALEEQTTVATPAGPMPAELLTFHPDGALHRLFPLNGKFSGYWGMKEESSLAVTLDLATPAGPIKAKLVGVRFLASGEFAGLTLWPGETVTINTPLGPSLARMGLAFYPSGALRSFEPAKPFPVPTPLGLIEAFDPHAQGVHGDTNSLAFSEDGLVISLATPVNTVNVLTPDGRNLNFAPAQVPNLCDERVKDIMALKIYFSPGKVSFHQPDQESFDLEACRFSVGKLLVNSFIPFDLGCEM